MMFLVFYHRFALLFEVLLGSGSLAWIQPFFRQRESLGNDHLTHLKASSNPVTTFLAFGDSLVDTGNNDYFITVAKSNLQPYGIDFPNQLPTGRFSNGRLLSDFVASYAGIKEFVPAYLDPTLSLEDLITGVCFASAGSGYDPKTSAISQSINIFTQLKFFDEYKKRLTEMVGEKRMKNVIKNSVIFVSSSSNDIGFTFAPLVAPPQTFVRTYLNILLEKSNRFLQGLIDGGAERIIVTGALPVGCIPVVITLRTAALLEPRRCSELVLSIAQQFNNMLEIELKAMQASHPNITLAYADIYTPLQHQINYPQNYGFKVVDRGCCGTGTVEVAILCDPLSRICNDRTEHVFWDSAHPTQKSYYLISQALHPTIDLVLRNRK